MPRARNPLRADNTTSSMNSNAVLLHDDRRVKGCKDFVGWLCRSGEDLIERVQPPGKDSCWIVILVLIRVELGVCRFSFTRRMRLLISKHLHVPVTRRNVP
jgi:hypothetical protein